MPTWPHVRAWTWPGLRKRPRNRCGVWGSWIPEVQSKIPIGLCESRFRHPSAQFNFTPVYDVCKCIILLNQGFAFYHFVSFGSG
jgi:hypothetical protein